MSATTPRLLNLGCGAHLHPAFTNVDQYVTAPGVLAADLSRPLPFAAGSFEAVYLSHVLEHFSRPAGALLLAEIHRVLAPQGTVRVVVPDLEQAARAYLAALDAEAAGSAPPGRHDWMIVELTDQMVRERSGGEMETLLHTEDPALHAFIEGRMGAAATDPGAPLQGLARLHHLPRVLGGLHTRAVYALVWLLGGPSRARAFAAGAFRASGEVHLAAYDRLSLSRALVAAGFTAPRLCTHDQSAIPGFAAYGLDTQGGKARKPDSLFLEATRP